MTGDPSERAPVEARREERRERLPVEARHLERLDRAPEEESRFERRDRAPEGARRYGRRERPPVEAWRYERLDRAPVEAMRRERPESREPWSQAPPRVVEQDGGDEGLLSGARRLTNRAFDALDEMGDWVLRKDRD
jgi:hypothetical protein